MTLSDIKNGTKQLRNSLQQGIYFIINPFVRLLIRMGVTPNIVTTIGFLGNIAAAAVLAAEGYGLILGAAPDYGRVTLAGALIIGFSLFDMLDGQVARLGGMTSTFGAMYDSVLDRYCELFTLGGIACWLIGLGDFTGVLLTFLALTGSIMVSYVRARAEGLGLECKIGFMQRPERVVVTALSLLAAGIYGQTAYDATAAVAPRTIVVAAMAIIAIFANMTAAARIDHSRKQLKSSNISTPPHCK